MSIEISNPNNTIESFEEFKKNFLEISSGRTGLEKTADLYQNVPVWVRILSNLDPTGTASAIAQILEENRQKREQDNMLHAIYCLGQAVKTIGERISVLDKDYLGYQIPPLTHKYFEYCSQSFEIKKIEQFRNVWMNCLLNTASNLNEKLYIFNLIASLSVEETVVLKIFFDDQHLVSFNDRQPIKLGDISLVIQKDILYVQQICVGLQAKGLLHDYGIGRYNYNGPIRFVMTDFVIRIINSIIEPLA